ncbi:MAG: LysR family transcriptional regulator [Zoogloeaceae bacterium]|nr:LysR family transcriptional regulator [Zoogloeaceae bacterium]
MFDAMQTFLDVVETGSFSAAAGRQNKNASSIARQIDRLEQDLGVRLFERSTRRLDLTQPGLTYHERVKQILQDIRLAGNELRQTPGEVQGDISITAFDSFGRTVLAPLLPEFSSRYPQASIILSLDNSIVDLYNSPMDIAVRFGPPQDATLRTRKLVDNETVLVAHPDYLALQPPITQPADLRRHNCLTLHRQRQHVFWHFERSAERIKVRVAGNFSACGGDPLVAFAVAGQGVLLISRWLVENEMRQGQLVEVLPDWQARFNERDSGAIHLVWRANAAQRPVVRAMLDFLVDRLTTGQSKPARSDLS